MDLSLFFGLSIFIFGLMIGSFLSAIIYRISTNQKEIIFGRSFCPHCKIKIKSYDLIPLFSYLFLRGKCRSCNKKISIQYFLLEIVTGFIFVETFIRFNFVAGTPVTMTIFWFIIFALMIGITFYDIKHMEIPSQLSFPLILLSALGSLIILNNDIWSIILGGFAGWLFFYLQYKISNGKWTGLGDSDLGLSIGLILGPYLLVESLASSYITASIFGITLIILKKAKLGSKIPFAPFLAIGLFVTVIFGGIIESILNY